MQQRSTRGVIGAIALFFLVFPLLALPQGGPPGGTPPGQAGTPPGQEPPASATVQVNCPTDSINAALQTPAVELTVEISGICVEDVVVTRDRVTLRGSDPDFDGIQAAETDENVEPAGAALMVRAASQVTVENLLLTGGIDSGLFFLNSRLEISVVNAHVNGNGNRGLLLIDSFVRVTDSEMLQNERRGVSLLRNSGFNCSNCTIEGDDGNIAVLLSHSSTAFLEGSQLTGGRVSCNTGSRAILDNTSISSPVHSIGAGSSCEVIMEGGTLAGSIRASRNAQVLLFDVEQTSVEDDGGGNPRSNSFSIASYLFSQGSELENVSLGLSSNGFMSDSGTNSGVVGEVSCNLGSDFFCAIDPSQIVSSNCEGCAICGDGFLLPSEQCDDGNTTDGDGCSASCMTE